MKINGLSIFIAVASVLLGSCSKDNGNKTPDVKPSENGPISVTVMGEMGEFAPGTKSTAESCMRMKWAEGDVVWTYDSDGDALGGLTVSLEDGNDYVAVMKGTLKHAPSGGTLFLVHSPLLSADTEPELTDMALSVDMSSQSAGVTPFVAYATVEGVTGGDAYEEDELRTKFSFATSVLKVNATGLTGNPSLTSASITGIETVCTLTINSSAGAFDIGGDTPGTLTKELSGTASLSRASFYLGVPEFNASSTKRMLAVVADGDNHYSYDVMKSGYGANSYVNYVYDVKTLDYVDENGVDRGNGTYIPSTGVVWAPVNLGYDDSHIYGRLYQWGRKRGQGYQGETPEADIYDFGENPFTTHVDVDGANWNTFFYSSNNLNSWYADSGSNTFWDLTGGSKKSHTPEKSNFDPCPLGWRVPTYAELEALIGIASGDGAGIMTGTHGSSTCPGAYFDGTSAVDPAAGIFLPASGIHYVNIIGTYYSMRDTWGYYWSSSIYDEDGREAWRLSFFNGERYTLWNSRGDACAIRCVQE